MFRLLSSLLSLKSVMWSVSLVSNKDSVGRIKENLFDNYFCFTPQLPLPTTWNQIANCEQRLNTRQTSQFNYQIERKKMIVILILSIASQNQLRWMKSLQPLSISEIDWAATYFTVLQLFSVNFLRQSGMLHWNFTK